MPCNRINRDEPPGSTQKQGIANATQFIAHGKTWMCVGRYFPFFDSEFCDDDADQRPERGRTPIANSRARHTSSRMSCPLSQPRAERRPSRRSECHRRIAIVRPVRNWRRLLAVRQACAQVPPFDPVHPAWRRFGVRTVRSAAPLKRSREAFKMGARLLMHWCSLQRSDTQVPMHPRQVQASKSSAPPLLAAPPTQVASAGGRLQSK